MKINEFSFRQLAYNYVLFYNISPDRFAPYALSFGAKDGDNAVLTYGYIDNDAGLSFELLCCAKRHPDGRVELREGKEDTSFKIRYDGIQSDVEVMLYSVLLDNYQKKVDMIMSSYGAGTDLEKIRKDTTFDADRYQSCPDDIGVLFFKPGVQMEIIWIRTSRIIDGKIAGYLLNQPNLSEFGVNQGDVIKIAAVRLEDGSVKAVADFPWIYG